MTCMYVDDLQPLRTLSLGQGLMYVKAYLYGQISTTCCAVAGDSPKAAKSIQADIDAKSLHNNNTQGNASHGYPRII